MTPGESLDVTLQLESYCNVDALWVDPQDAYPPDRDGVAYYVLPTVDAVFISSTESRAIAIAKWRLNGDMSALESGIPSPRDRAILEMRQEWIETVDPEMTRPAHARNGGDSAGDRMTKARLLSRYCPLQQQSRPASNAYRLADFCSLNIFQGLMGLAGPDSKRKAISQNKLVIACGAVSSWYKNESLRRQAGKAGMVPEIAAMAHLLSAARLGFVWRAIDRFTEARRVAGLSASLKQDIAQAFQEYESSLWSAGTTKAEVRLINKNRIEEMQNDTDGRHDGSSRTPIQPAARSASVGYALSA